MRSLNSSAVSRPSAVAARRTSMTRSRSASEALRSGELAGSGGSPVGGMSAGTSLPVPLGSSSCTAVHAGEITLHRALATTALERVKVARKALGSARARPPGPELLHELACLVLGDLDEVVLQIATLSRDQRGTMLPYKVPGKCLIAPTAGFKVCSTKHSCRLPTAT